nr:MAG: hypothetical protein BECKUNK1418H_GA0071006_10535 [Candidatus Kentron sp. UNK]
MQKKESMNTSSSIDDPLQFRLQLSEDARVRKEGERFLIVNLATQGLHFISPMAYQLVAVLDGTRTVMEAIRVVYPDHGPELEVYTRSFIEGLVQRKLLVPLPTE